MKSPANTQVGSSSSATLTGPCMDAQVVMAVFSYLYFNSYVAREVTFTVGSVLQVRGPSLAFLLPS